MRISLTLAFLLFSSVAHAHTPITETYCEGAKTQLDLNDCSAEALQDSEKQLKETYDQAVKKLTETNQSAKLTLFQQTHEIWEEYKDKNCEVEAGKRQNSGSIWPYLVASCNARMNFQRVEEIKATTFLNQ